MYTATQIIEGEVAPSAKFKDIRKLTCKNNLLLFFFFKQIA